MRRIRKKTDEKVGEKSVEQRRVEEKKREGCIVFFAVVDQYRFLCSIISRI